MIHYLLSVKQSVYVFGMLKLSVSSDTGESSFSTAKRTIYENCAKIIIKNVINKCSIIIDIAYLLLLRESNKVTKLFLIMSTTTKQNKMPEGVI